MDEGGEAACWLDRVCDACGKLRERSGLGPWEHCGDGGGRTAAPAEPGAVEPAPAESVPAEPGAAEPGNEKSPWADHRR
ncbi:hypothetical protein ACFXAF_23350 [Kitasatospora sp. NPDC059463]|uniref:hypothetical protein n=1 Tax=Kitasatospora sp. NPDC059463 TaxID=3346842 RepID=UPI0036A19BE5